jgi:iron complex outermembrane recepter protein
VKHQLSRHPDSVLLCGASLAILALASAPAAAQETGDRARGDEIVVTATKVATNLQETPIAITAVTSETLQNRGLTDSADLGAIVPNATFRQTQGAYGRGLSAFIRGVGQADTGLQSEPGVAFYIDDAYYPLVLGSIFDLLDLDHVEVLRGPQGTLFGRNTLAGAVNIVSKEPDQEPSAYLQFTAGSRSRFDIRGGFNTPLTDTLAMRITGFMKKQDGYQKRLDFRCEMIRRGTPELAGDFPFQAGENFDISVGDDPGDCVVGRNGGTDAFGVRSAFKWEPTDRLEVSLTGDYSEDNSTVQPDHILEIDPSRALRPGVTAPAALWGIAYDERFLTGDPYTTFATYRDPVPAGTEIPGSGYYNGSLTRGGIGFDPVNPVRNWGVTGKFIYALTDEIDFTFIGGMRDVMTSYTFDQDQSPLMLELTSNVTTHTQHTLEARFTGQMEWVDWVFGGFYYRGQQNAELVVSSPFSNLLRFRDDTYEPKNNSVYANVTLRPFGDRLSFNLGGRFSDDSKPLSFNNIQDGVPSGDIVFDQVLSSERFDWKFGANYRLTDETMVYASAATGFRLPSFNSRPFQPSQVYQVPGDDLIAYELGVKTDMFDNRLRLNAVAFYTDYKQRTTTIGGSEYQLDPNGAPLPGNQITEPLPGGPAGSTQCRPLTQAEIDDGVDGFACVPRTYATNTPAEVYGVEVELQAEPVDRLTFDAAMGYSKTDSPDLETPGRITDRVLGIPEWTASAGAQYEFVAPALAGTITPRLDWLYQGPISFSTSRADLIQDGYSVFNARLTYYNEKHDVSIALSGTNIFDKFYYYNYFDLTRFGFPQLNAQPSRPREWAITVTKRF